MIIKLNQSESLNRKEANDYVKSVKDLQSAMHIYVSVGSSQKLSNAQHLMQTAMKRLEKELYHILSTRRAELDPESVVSNTSSEAMTDLRLIAECMISAGYGKECVKIYKITRKSIVDEALYDIGIEPVTQNQMDKWNWEVVDLKIKNWVSAIEVAVKTVFAGERLLCDFVFSTSDSISESCFKETTQHGATILFNFPHLVAKRKKSTSPENIFRTLDLYVSISQLFPDIETVFSFDSTTSIRSQAASSLVRLQDVLRVMLTEFESAIQKDSSKKKVPGGGIHPLTRYVMNYICYLSDYTDTDQAQGQQLLSADRFTWLILVLLCKLDDKTQVFKDVSLSYLFLANNLNYVINKIRSSNLVMLLDEEWIPTHQLKLTQYSANYQRVSWGKVLSTLPNDMATPISRQQAIQYFQRFSSAFEAAHRTQSTWVVSDYDLRQQITTSVAQTLLPPYQEFYDNYLLLVEQDYKVKLTPDDLQKYLSNLFSWSDSSSTA